MNKLELGLIPGVKPHEKDAEIMKAVDRAKRARGGCKGTIIAIKNESGAIYRRIELHGLQQEFNLSERLEDIGLKDETEQGARRPKGVWAVWGPGRDMSLEALKKSISNQSYTPGRE